MRSIDSYIKAVIGALIAGLGSYQTAVADNSGVTSGEWAAIAIATIAALGLVYAIPNTGASSTEDDDPEAQAGDEVEDPTA